MFAVQSDAVFGVGGLALGVIGVVLAVVFYVRGRALPRLVYAVTAYPVVGPLGISDVEIRYRGAVVSRVVRTQVLAWNDGRATLRSSDIPPLDPLRAKLHAGTVLARAKQSSSPANEVVLGDVDDNGWHPVNLTYLDPGQGFIVEFTHDGDAATSAATLRGSIIGSGAVTEFRPNRWRQRSPIWMSVGLALLSLTSAFIPTRAWSLRIPWLVAMALMLGWLAATAALKPRDERMRAALRNAVAGRSAHD